MFEKNGHIRGLLFTFVYFLYSRSDVFDRVIKVLSSGNRCFLVV